MLRPWFWNFPHDLIFSILYAKLRIGFGIFTSTKIKRVTTSWQDLLKWVCQVMIGEIVILTVWSVLGEPHSVAAFQTLALDGSNFIEVTMTICVSKYDQIFSIILLAYKLCWYLVGSFMALKITVGATMAFQIWNMKKQQGETRFVGLATLNYLCFACGMAVFVVFWTNPVELIFGQSLFVLWISTSTAMLSIWPVLKKVEMKRLFRPASHFSFSSKFSSINLKSVSARIPSGRHKNTAREAAASPLDSSMTAESRHMRSSSFQDKDKSILRSNRRGSVGASNASKVGGQLEPLQEDPERSSNTDIQHNQDPIVDHRYSCAGNSQEMNDFMECENDEGSILSGEWENEPTLLIEPLSNSSPRQYLCISFDRHAQEERNSDTIENMLQETLFVTPCSIII